MRRIVFPIGLVVLAAAYSVASGAQTCSGAASYAAGLARVGAGADFSSDVTSYGAERSAGMPTGPFGGVTVSRVEYQNVSDVGTDLSVAGGYAVNLGASKAAQVCPVVGYLHQWGPTLPTLDGDVHSSSDLFQIGGSIGGILTSTSSFAFVPFAGAVYVAASASVNGLGSSASTTQNYGLVTAGAGFIVNQVLTIRPSLAVPVGLTGAKSVFEIALGFNFGARARTP